jgi:hypothetical protein
VPFEHKYASQLKIVMSRKYSSVMLDTSLCALLVRVCLSFFSVRLEIFALDCALFRVHELASLSKAHARDLIISIPKRAPSNVH